MTTELTMLVWCVVLVLVLPYTYVVGLLGIPRGLAWGTSNREQPLVGEAAWATCRRAHANTIENLVPFAPWCWSRTSRTNERHDGARRRSLGSARCWVVHRGLVPWRTVAFAVASGAASSCYSSSASRVPGPVRAREDGRSFT
jgi:hypothetical protein